MKKLFIVLTIATSTSIVAACSPKPEIEKVKYIDSISFGEIPTDSCLVDSSKVGK